MHERITLRRGLAGELTDGTPFRISGILSVTVTPEGKMTDGCIGVELDGKEQVMQASLLVPEMVPGTLRQEPPTAEKTKT